MMPDPLEIHAGDRGLIQDRATAAWDMAMAVAKEGYPGGDAEDFDLDAVAATLIDDWTDRTEGTDIDPLHSVTSLRIAAGMFVKGCRVRESVASLACGLICRIRMIARYNDVTQEEFDSYFGAWWRPDEELDDRALVLIASAPPVPSLPVGHPGPQRAHRSHSPVRTEKPHLSLHPGTPPILRAGPPLVIDGKVSRDFPEQRHERVLRVNGPPRIPPALLGETAHA